MMIQQDFKNMTLLCIAHRREWLLPISGPANNVVNTIVYYDRVLVMDKGTIAEFDTPLNLYDKEGASSSGQKLRF